MASKRRQRRVQAREQQKRKERQCLGKVTYTSENVARSCALAIGRIKSETLREYRCPLCSTADQNRYHIGHDPGLKGARLSFPV